jgi:hypothetical protein
LEKERFLELARNYTSLTKEETNDLDALQREFPYSQVIHNLASRGAQDNGMESSRQFLTISAVYSSDRSVLKDIITSPRTERGTTTEIEILPDHSSGGVADEILIDLDRLQELKHNFELSFEALQHPKKGPVKKKKEETEVLLDEIQIKNKFVPESTKQKEQIEIIDQFIKKGPSIKKNIASADASDLAEMNFALTENVVSETLVEILLRQGKKDKAIEVLKKLIWKFPQKKAIFAAQIDELKK